MPFGRLFQACGSTSPSTFTSVTPSVATKIVTDQNKNNDSSRPDTDNPDLQTESRSPEHVKENDVEDECLHGTEKEEKEEEEYLDILGNGSLRRKVMCCMNIMQIHVYSNYFYY